MFRSCNLWRVAAPIPGFRSSTLKSSWALPSAGASSTWPGKRVVTQPPFGASVVVTSSVASTASSRKPHAPAARRSFPPLQRAQIVQLACLEPIAQGLHVTHWSSFDLARQAIAQGIVDRISPRTVRQILHEVDLQPHRTRYWKTSSLDAQFKERAEKILWCYGNARYLAAEGLWVVCVDEIPNFQVLERKPLRRAVPGHIEQQEFEYIRHGTVNLLLLLIVHSGKMEAAYLPAKNAAHYIRALEDFRRRHRHLAGSFLIQDGDPSHTAAATHQYFAAHRDWWRPRFTPVHASWLDQAELLVGAFGRRYLKRAAWSSREELLKHVRDSWPEYNHLYAHPFEWCWTNHQMRQWFAKHAAK
jgi:hypothetical protein